MFEDHALPIRGSDIVPRWRILAAPVLLVVVALAQRFLMQEHRLDPWKCGGFGMFSGTSLRALRQLTVTLVPADGNEYRFPPAVLSSRIPLGGDIRKIRARVLTMPLQSMLDN